MGHYGDSLPERESVVVAAVRQSGHDTTESKPVIRTSPAQAAGFARAMQIRIQPLIWPIVICVLTGLAGCQQRDREEADDSQTVENQAGEETSVKSRSGARPTTGLLPHLMDGPGKPIPTRRRHLTNTLRLQS